MERTKCGGCGAPMVELIFTTVCSAACERAAPTAQTSRPSTGPVYYRFAYGGRTWTWDVLTVCSAPHMLGAGDRYDILNPDEAHDFSRDPGGWMQSTGDMGCWDDANIPGIWFRGGAAQLKDIVQELVDHPGSILVRFVMK